MKRLTPILAALLALALAIPPAFAVPQGTPAPSSGAATSVAPGADLSSGNVTASGGSTSQSLGAWLTSLVYGTPTVTSLRAFPTALVSDGSVAFAAGYAAAGDGGAGHFTWSAASTTADDGGIVIRPTAVASGSPGRWLRVVAGPVSVKAWGAKGDGSTDDTTALLAAAAYSATQPISLPCGIYPITATFAVPLNGVVSGASNYAWYYGLAHTPTTKAPCALLKSAASAAWSTAAGVVTLGGYTHVRDLGVDAGSTNTLPVIYTKQPFDELFHIFTNGGTYGLYVDYNASVLVQGTRLFNSYLTQAHGDCVYIQTSADYQIVNNDLAACTNYSLNLNGSSAGIIANNFLQDSTQGGLRLAGGSDGNAFTGNRFDADYLQGIYFAGVTGSNSFSGNNFRNSGQAGGLTNAALVWNNSTHTGCQVFSGNSYTTTNSATKWIASVALGAVLSPCNAFYERLPAQGSGVFSPTASAAISALTWSSNLITVTTSAAHGMGTTGQVQVTISGAAPSGYNGTYWCNMTGTTTFTCPQATTLASPATTAGAYVAQFTAAKLQPFWNPTPADLPGPYANDNAAASSGVPVGAEYKDASGIRRQRVS